MVAIKKRKSSRQGDLMRIEWVPREEVKFWKENPRKNTHAARSLAGLLFEHGIRSAINVWDQDMVAYKGNTTLKALDILWADKVYPGSRAKLWPGNVFVVPVIKHHFGSYTEACEYGISDNKASEMAEWDEDVLLVMLQKSRNAPSRTGFSAREVSNLAFLADEAKLRDIEATDEGMMARVRVTCRPENKEEIVEILRDWAKDSGYQDIEVR